jgi:ribonuclease HI
MKINVDAAISKNTNRASAAAIVRDGGVQFLGASALVVDGCVDLETMEVVACCEGLALASDLMLQRFKLASDCKSVVRSIHKVKAEDRMVRLLKRSRTKLATLSRVSYDRRIATRIV